MEEQPELWTVGEVAELVGVSVRTLHHWDSIGLASPSWRSAADYRLYEDADIARVHNILLYRETGMALKDIRALLESDQPAASHLRRQLSLLQQQAERVSSKITAVHQLLEETMTSEKPLNAEDRAKILGNHWDPAWEKEAEEQWGQTEQWAQSQQRAASMNAEEFTAANERIEAVEAEMAELQSAGEKPDSAAAVRVAEKYREVLSEWFPISPEMHVMIAEGYVADERFRERFQRRSAGLAQWVKAAIEANAVAQGVDVQNAQWR